MGSECYQRVYNDGKIIGHHGGSAVVFYHKGDHVVVDMDKETVLRRYRDAGHQTQTAAFGYARGYDAGIDN